MIFIKVRNFSKCVVTKTRYMYIFEKVALEGEGNNVWKCTFLIKFSSHLQIWFFCKVHIRGKLCYTYNITKIGQVIVFLDYTRMKTIDGNIQDDKNRYIYIYWIRKKIVIEKVKQKLKSDVYVIRFYLKCKHVYLLFIPALMSRSIKVSHLVQINNKTQIYVN